MILSANKLLLTMQLERDNPKTAYGKTRSFKRAIGKRADVTWTLASYCLLNYIF